MSEDLLRTRKRTRFDPALYAVSSYACSVSICTLDRQHVFRDAPFATACVDILVTQARDNAVQLHAYCLMPDHLHLLISPSKQQSIIEFVREFKSRSTRVSWQHGFSGKIWQQGFYDHFLRRDENLDAAVRYILDNPVRKAIVQDWHKYPYCGSLTVDLCMTRM